MPWPVPAAREIFSRMAAQLEQELQSLNPNIDPSAISRAVRSNHGLLSLIQRTAALEAREIHDHLAWIVRQYFIDSCDDDYVDIHAGIWQISRRPATKAFGMAEVEDDSGAVLAEGAELAAEDGSRFVVTHGVHLGDAGKAEAHIAAKLAGEAGNLPAGARLTPIEPMPHIAKITVAEPGLADGAEEESLAELRDKIRRRIRQPPHGGAAFDYEIWLKGQFPVRAVAVAPDWVGRGSVGVIVAMRGADGGGRKPTEAEMEAMLSYLGKPNSASGVKPVTAYVVIVAAEPRLIDITLRIKPDTVAVRQAIIEAFNAFIATVGDDNDTFNVSPIGALIERSRLSEALSAAAGEYAHDIILPADNIQLGKTEYAQPGEVTFADAAPAAQKGGA